MIEVKNLNKTYDRGRPNANQALYDVSLTLPQTGFVCILGPSGCGKTSLLNAIGGLDRFDSGTLSTGDTAVSRYGTAAYEAERNRSFGYIFQNYYLLPEHSVAYNVYLGLHSLELSHKEKLRRVREALEAVEMGNYLRRTVGELSGGQQQRVAIARALARKPRVIFADEPTGNLDEANTLNICSLLRRISRTSLVVMVTHEQRIAQFYADRIITLENGRLKEDTQSWERTALSADPGKAVYAGDYREQTLSADGLELRLLTEEGAQPVKLTVVALRDRVILKLTDSRGVSCGDEKQQPVLLEGRRPQVQLDAQDSPAVAIVPEDQKQTRAGRGITPAMMAREALHLARGKGLRRVSTGLFLVLLTVLMIFTVSDYLTVASIDPEDFITSHSQMLEINIEQGSNLYTESKGLLPMVEEFMAYLRAEGKNFRFVPHVPATAEYSVTFFRQMEATAIDFGKFSYAPLSTLDPSTLIHGRMPRNSQEIVVDRWVLEAAMQTDGIIQNGIPDVTYFLGCRLHYSKKTFAPTIVGICDSAEPAFYVHEAGLISIGVNGVEVTPLSELKQAHPGEFDHVTLGEGECLVVTTNAGEGYKTKIGGVFSTSTRSSARIVDAIESDRISGSIVMDDNQLESLMWDMVNKRFHIYCEDKAAMLSFLQKKTSPIEEAGYGVVNVTDRYADTYAAYQEATSRKADARTIVTATVIVISLAMLYLLQRSQIHSRLGMLAVYRLLGIPKAKLGGIFLMESGLYCLTAALPAALLSWGYIAVAGKIPELESALLMPWQAAVWVFAAICGYHALVSLLPLYRLLALPPAQLASKYDL